MAAAAGPTGPSTILRELLFCGLCIGDTNSEQPAGEHDKKDQEYNESDADVRLHGIADGVTNHQEARDHDKNHKSDDNKTYDVGVPVRQPPVFNAAFDDRPFLSLVALPSVKFHLLPECQNVSEPLAQLYIEEAPHKRSQG